MRGFWKFAVVSLLGIGSAAGQAPLPMNGIAHVAVRVKNLDAAEDFYKKLGFVQAFALSRNGKVYEAFVKINDRQVLELYPATETQTDIGFLHICYDVVDDNALHDDYVSRGLTPKAVQKGASGNMLFVMQGPENITMEYLQYLPGSLHMKDAGQHLDPDRVAEKMMRVSLAMKDKNAARSFFADKLGFTASATNPMLLNIPGSSGTQVEIVGDTLGRRSDVTLATKDMKKAEVRLKTQGVPFKRDHKALLVSDPDGNLWRIAPER